jgi:hypothetical protein
MAAWPFWKCAMPSRSIPARCSAFFLAVGIAGNAAAASDTDIQTLERFALLLGRGIGCELNTDQAVAYIDAWFEQTFPPVSAERQRNLSHFKEIVRFHAQEQRSGESPDDCSNMSNAFKALGW